MKLRATQCYACKMWKIMEERGLNYGISIIMQTCKAQAGEIVKRISYTLSFERPFCLLYQQVSH